MKIFHKTSQNNSFFGRFLSIFLNIFFWIYALFAHCLKWSHDKFATILMFDPFMGFFHNFKGKPWGWKIFFIWIILHGNGMPHKCNKICYQRLTLIQSHLLTLSPIIQIRSQTNLGVKGRSMVEASSAKNLSVWPEESTFCRGGSSFLVHLLFWCSSWNFFLILSGLLLLVLLLLLLGLLLLLELLLLLDLFLLLIL